MRIFTKKFLILFLAVLILTAVFFSPAQASFLDSIRAWVTINPLLVDVSAPSKVEINKVFKIEAEIINKGEEKIESAKGEIFLPSELILLKKDPVQEIGVIPGKKEKKIIWQIQGEKVGDYVISVKVIGELREEIISVEGNTSVEIKESMPRGRIQEFFQNLFGFFQKLFLF